MSRISVSMLARGVRWQDVVDVLLLTLLFSRLYLWLRRTVAAQIAKHVFGVKVVATRVFDPLREEMYRNMGLRTINPTRVQARRLKRMIQAPSDEAANELVLEFMQQEGR